MRTLTLRIDLNGSLVKSTEGVLGEVKRPLKEWGDTYASTKEGHMLIVDIREVTGATVFGDEEILSAIEVDIRVEGNEMDLFRLERLEDELPVNSRSISIVF